MHYYSLIPPYNVREEEEERKQRQFESSVRGSLIETADYGLYSDQKIKAHGGGAVNYLPFTKVVARQGSECSKELAWIRLINKVLEGLLDGTHEHSKTRQVFKVLFTTLRLDSGLTAIDIDSTVYWRAKVTQGYPVQEGAR